MRKRKRKKKQSHAEVSAPEKVKGQVGLQLISVRILKTDPNSVSVIACTSDEEQSGIREMKTERAEWRVLSVFSLRIRTEATFLFGPLPAPVVGSD